MSSVLHPVGPEAPQTYWLRRVVVIAAVVLVVALVVALIVHQTGGASATASGTPASSAVPAAPSPGTSKADPSPQAKSTASAKPKATKPTKAPITSCPPDQLRTTLNGKTRLKPKKKNTFQISLINGSGLTCKLSVSSADFELKIYSGKDRIWSTKDCASSVKKIDTKLKDERSVAWKITWDGRRSRDGCKRRPEVPRAGTYFATAQFAGAKPVQLRMILR